MVKLRRVFESEKETECPSRIFRRFERVYLTEAEDKREFSWRDPEVQGAILDAISGLEINKTNTTKKELIFKHNGKNGSMSLRGYMLFLDTDTDDNIPPTSFPVKDKNNLTLDNLLATIKTVFSKREAKKAEPKEDVDPVEEKRLDEKTEEKKESVDISEENKEVVDEENASDETEDKEEAVSTEENATIDVKEESAKTEDSVEESSEEPKEVTESVEDHIDGIPNIHNSVVFQDVAKERFVDLLKDSLIISPEFKGELDIERIKNPIWVALSPSYAISQISNILVPVMLKDRMVTLPVADMPDPDAVFDGELTEDALADYGMAVQDYLIKDAPISEVIELDMDNSEDARTLVVDLINKMAEDYQEKREGLAKLMDLSGEDILKESRYFIVPDDTDLTKEVNKINQVGYTDLGLAKKDLEDMIDSGQFPFALRILDTNFSKNKEKWTLL